MGEVMRKPLVFTNEGGKTFTVFDEDHTLGDILRWLCENKSEAEDLLSLLTIQLEKKYNVTYPRPSFVTPQIGVMVCRKCNKDMNLGIYTKQTYVGGIEDFVGDGYSSTFSAGGTGEVDVCWKCPDCGRSVTKGAT